jgi:hypothetical protein
MHVPSSPHEGRIAIVTDAGWDAVDAGGATDESACRRTAKSCGPDASTPASSRRENIPPATVTRKPDRRGEHEISRKPLRAGMPGDFRCDRCEYSCAFELPTSHTRLRVHWAPGIPHALFLLGGMFKHNSGASRRGNAKLCSMSSTAPHTSSRHPRHRVSPSASPMTGSSGNPVFQRRMMESRSRSVC